MGATDVESTPHGGGSPMAVNEGQDPEAIWVELLSRQPARIRSAAHALPADERGPALAGPGPRPAHKGKGGTGEGPGSCPPTEPEAVVPYIRRLASVEGWP